MTIAHFTENFDGSTCAVNRSYFRETRTTNKNSGSGKALYKCDQCEYKTSWPSWLKTHMRVHTGERPFKCGLCEYTSSQSSNLQQHLKRHSDERPYKCNICDYSCKRGHQLVTHKRCHFGKRRTSSGMIQDFIDEFEILPSFLEVSSCSEDKQKL